MNALETSTKSETDVLVVGAGPVGLTMACELLRRGIRCRIVDSSDAPSRTSKALTVQPRTLEVLQDMGIVEGFLEKGVRTNGASIYEGEKRLLRPDTRRLETPYPYVACLPQSDTERLLIGLLRELGGEVERSRELVGLGQRGERVSAFIRETGGGASTVEEIEAGWLVGCDGAHSFVRRTLGVPFEKDAYEEEFLLADVDVDWGRGHDQAHAWLHGDGVFLALPLPGSRRWRLISGFASERNEEAPRASVEVFRRLLADRTGDKTASISNPTWLSNYRYSRGMVPEYRRGRVFLMGDAAHIHSPVGGQGMNTGMQDAYNLAWKLALVAKNKAPDKLLDTYEEERLPVAKEVLRGTHVATNLLVSGNPVLRFVRGQALPRLLGSGLVPEDFVLDTLLEKVSELDVGYRKSSLSRSYNGLLWRGASPTNGGRAKPGVGGRTSFGAAPRAGDRAPYGRCLRYPSREETNLSREFEGTGFTLLLFAGPSRTREGYANLAGVARKVEESWDGDVETRVVVAGNDKPENLDWDGTVLLDARRELHGTYGAGMGALYLVRPDGYIGFRSQPVRGDQLLRYLGNLLPTAPVPSGTRQSGEAGARGGRPYARDDAGGDSVAR